MSRLNKKISPSIMCGDWLNIEKMIYQLEAAKADWIHVDIMDGHYVPNITFGFDMVNQIRRIVDIPLDVHMMVYHPERFFNRFELDQRDIISVHYEAVEHMNQIIHMLKQKKVKIGIALNPGTDVSVLRTYVEDLYMVLLMMNQPGGYGKSMEAGMMDKIRETKTLINKSGKKVLIEVDGSVSYVLAGEMSRAGADIFVAGTSSIFNKTMDLRPSVQKLRRIVNHVEPNYYVHDLTSLKQSV
ncbi:ribulose-phosphate 3-epimerase [Petrocella sp. FN5]|uniref:ribulose-phosphate 3-epimerase n=1 Tax=Petrocella sp. FN5 TaxID=3032002 RepID=UPI0023D9ACFD|nr:ribulose-phosphate 3-epimerase [Petrocella sp. FN5]MDF1618514.1 ribulose-phosphate 3-epimerase [Petrocella sp. FN5]